MRKKHSSTSFFALCSLMALLLVNAIGTTHAMEMVNKRKKGSNHTQPIKKRRILNPEEQQKIDRLESVAEINETTILMEAVYDGDLHMVETLLSQFGKDPNEKANTYTSLHAACQAWSVGQFTKAIMNTQKEIIKTLLHHGADANIIDIQGQTPLHEACKYLYGLSKNHKLLACETLDILLKNKANPNIIDLLGHSPLEIAANLHMRKTADRSFCNRAVKALLDHDANPDIKVLPNGTHPNRNIAAKSEHLPRRSITQLAQERGHHTTATLLQEASQAKLAKLDTLILCLRENNITIPTDIVNEIEQSINRTANAI